MFHVFFITLKNSNNDWIKEPHIRGHPAPRGLPRWMLLNKEVWETVQKFTKINCKVKKSRDRSLNGIRYPHIDPTSDVVYCDMRYWPRRHEVPNIVTVAASFHTWTNWIYRRPGLSHLMFSRIRELELELKDILLVRRFDGTIKTAMNDQITTLKAQNKSTSEYQIHRHPCVFFGLQNDKIEQIIERIEGCKPSKQLLYAFTTSASNWKSEFLSGTPVHGLVLPRVTLFITGAWMRMGFGTTQVKFNLICHLRKIETHPVW